MDNSFGKKTTTRQDFLRKFVTYGGVNYAVAARVYEAMCGLFADAITTGQKINIGRVLTIKPIRRKARKVTMGFRSKKQTIYLSDRIMFKTVVFREFLNRHALDWKL